MSQKEPSPSLAWEFQRLDNTITVPDELLNQFLQVCVDGFGFDSNEWMNDNRKKLATSTILGRLLDNQDR
jgi:hypothetical protein